MIAHLQSRFLTICSILFLSGITSPAIVDAAKPGTLLWEHNYNGWQNGLDWGTGVVIDSNYLIYSSGSTDFGNLTAAATGIKYDKTGSLIEEGWPVSVSLPRGGAFEAFYDAAVDSENDIYFVGNTYQQFESSGVYPAVLLLQKHGAGGGATPIWWDTAPPTSADSVSVGHAITVDRDNNVYVAGYMNDGTGSTKDNWIVAKYSSGGVEAWTIDFNNEYDTDLHLHGNDQAMGVAVDSLGKIIVAGYIGYDDLTPSTDLGWKVIKYNNDSTEVTSWNDAPYNPGPYDDIPRAVAVNSQDDIIVVGKINSGSDDSDWVVRKYAGDTGDEVWTETFTGGTSAQAFAVVIDDQDRIYVGGSDEGLWRLELRSSSGALLKEHTWSNLSFSAIRGLFLRDNTLAITGYANGETNRDWHTELWDISSFSWTMFMPAITGVNP